MAPEDPCLCLSTQVCQFKTAHDFSCRVSDALLWHLCACMSTGTHTDTHKYKINIPFLEKKDLFWFIVSKIFLVSWLCCLVYFGLVATQSILGEGVVLLTVDLIVNEEQRDRVSGLSMSPGPLQNLYRSIGPQASDQPLPLIGLWGVLNG